MGSLRAPLLCLNRNGGRMNWDQIEGKWKEFTGKAQQQWGKLTDDDLQQAKGDRRELSGKIQSAYGVTKEEADRQIDDWMGRQN